MTRLQELEGLIDLAENISNDLNHFSSRATKLKMWVYLLIVLIMSMSAISITFFLSAIMEVSWDFKIIVVGTLIVFTIVSSFYLINITMSLKKIRRNIRKESLILRSLLDMIHAQKESVVHRESLIQQAIIDMRLNRISYSDIMYHVDYDYVKRIVSNIEERDSDLY